MEKKTFLVRRKTVTTTYCLVKADDLEEANEILQDDTFLDFLFHVELDTENYTCDDEVLKEVDPSKHTDLQIYET